MKFVFFVFGVVVMLGGCVIGVKDDEYVVYYLLVVVVVVLGVFLLNQMDVMMRLMQEMYDKMMVVKMQEECVQLMQEYKKFMQEGMGMMGWMCGVLGLGVDKGGMGMG